MPAADATELKIKLREKRAELDRRRHAFLGDLTNNPNNGWLSNTTLREVMRSLAENKVNPSTFIGQGEYRLAPISKSTVLGEYDKQFNASINKIRSGEGYEIHGEDDAEKAEPPYYFFIMPRSNHFVLVKVTEDGQATHYNELDSYDKASIDSLKKLGFTEENINKHNNSGAKYTQPDGWSCGDRALRNLCELMGINHPITRAQTSAQLRQNGLTLVENTFNQKDVVKELKIEIKQLENELIALGTKPEEIVPHSTLSNSADINAAPDLRQNFLSDKHRKKIITNLQNKGWEHKEHQIDDKVTSVEFQKTSDPDSKFRIYENSLETHSTSVETFQAMLEAFKIAHPNKEPSVKTESPACAKLWDKAYEKVFGKAAPESFVNARNDSNNEHSYDPPRP